MALPFTKSGLFNGKNLNLLWPRRISQVFFLALWYYMFFRSYVITEEYIFKGNPVPDLFLRTDPLAGVITSAAARAFSHELIWWVPVVALSFIFGRAYCGWICPLGTWIDLRDYIVLFWNKFLASFKCRINKNAIATYRQRMNWKFYILIFIVVSAFLGSSFGGYMDPLCIIERATAFTVRPFLGEMEKSLAGTYTVFGYGFTKDHFFHYNFFVGLFFVALLTLNTVYRRFWCRVLCPLGAFFGVIGRFALLKLKVDQKTCTSCMHCVVDCKMGAFDFPEPKAPVSEYRAEECIQCYACVDICPDSCISIGPDFNIFNQLAKKKEKVEKVKEFTL